MTPNTLHNTVNTIENQSKSIKKALFTSTLFLLCLLFLFLSCTPVEDEVKDNDDDHAEESDLDIAIEDAIHHLEETPIAKSAGSNFSTAGDLEDTHKHYRITLVTNEGNTNADGNLAPEITYHGYVQILSGGEGDNMLIASEQEINYKAYDAGEVAADEHIDFHTHEGHYYSVLPLGSTDYYLYITSASETVSLVYLSVEEGTHHDEEHDH